MIRGFVVLFLGLVLTPPLGAIEYYRSNALGMKLEQISEIRLDEFEYTLTVEVAGNKEVRILKRQGEEVSRRTVETLADGTLQETEITGDERIVRKMRDGRLMEETLERSGELEEIRRYIYDDAGLVKKEISGPGGILYTDHFERTDSGRLRRVIREFPDGTSVVSRYSTGPEGLAEEAHTSGEETTRFRYTGSILVAEENWNGDELLTRTEFFPEDSSERETDFTTDTVTTRFYDKEDRVVREVIESPGGREIREYSYRGKLLTEETRRIKGVVERWVYEYGEGDERTAFDYYRDNELIKRRVFENEDTYRDIIMRAGKPILEVYYEEHVQVRTEYLEEGTR